MLFDLIKETLAPLEWEIYDTDSTGATTDCYIVVIGATPSRTSEEDIGARVFGAGVIIRVVGIAPAQVRTVLLKSRSLLRGLHAKSSEGNVAFHFDGTPRPIQVERRVPAGDGRNVCYIDDEYTVYGYGEDPE